MPERNYEFRKRLNQVHAADRRDPSKRPRRGETVLRDGCRIRVDADAPEHVVRAAQDLQDYLLRSMRVSALLVREPAGTGAAPSRGTIRLTTKTESPGWGSDLTVPRSFRLVVDSGSVVICGRDERGVSQGCHHLEDLMNLREAPYLEKVDGVRRPLFSPRMVHSGWGIDQYPDAHLNAIAHAGMDAILLFVKGVDTTTTGYLDINDLIDRASRFGIDVYLYSYLVSRLHPDDPEAPAYYESTYGSLVRAHPGAKGIVFVGESCEFPSKDPRTTGRLRLDPPPDGKRDSRPSPGWWPCVDYPRWLDLLKNTVRKYNPDLDIVFWTYNWGWAPEAERLALIRALPGDVSLQATFEMFEEIVKDGIVTRCVDYTASFEGPGRYFRSEAEVARERGLRLYTMSNTGGLTWDIGVIPYEPIPFQWARRYRGLLEARQDWGLVGLMESHHYGWWPSFISELAKWAYWEPSPPFEEMIGRIAERDFGPLGGPLAVRAWQAWSDAFRDYVPTNEDQYGPFRIGPAYPLLLQPVAEPLPSAPHAHFGNEIVQTVYRPHRPEDLETEIRLLERMQTGWEEGISLLTRAVERAPDRKRAEALRILNLGRFIRNCVRTTLNAKRWWRIREGARSESDPARANALIDDLVRLAEAEIENARATIPLVEEDSRLGWEPSMEYMTDRAHLEWKIARVRRVIKEEIPTFRAERGKAS